MLFTEEIVRHLTDEERRMERIAEHHFQKMMPQIEKMVEQKIKEAVENKISYLNF